MVELMGVVHLRHVRSILAERSHKSCRIAVYKAEQSHTETVVRAPHQSRTGALGSSTDRFHRRSPSGSTAHHGHTFAHSSTAHCLSSGRSGKFDGNIGIAECVGMQIPVIGGIYYRHYLVTTAAGYAFHGMSHLTVTYYGYFHYLSNSFVHRKITHFICIFAAMKHLTIGFDAKRAVLNLTGIGNYSRLVLDVLTSRYPDNRYLLFTPHFKPNPRLTELLDRPGIEIRTPDSIMGRISTHMWRTRGLTSQLRRSSLDLYHGLSNELPAGIARSGIPSVVTIHDLIFRRVPESYHTADRRICDWKFRRAADAATRIIAISRRTAADIEELYGIDPAKIDIVYQGCAPMFHKAVTQDSIDAVRARYRLPDRYIAAVGTVEMRKNQLLAVKALPMLPKALKLVIVGRRSGYAPELDRAIAAAGVGDRVQFLTGVDFTDLPAIYAGATVASYTSRYEGFGIPVIEAIAAGTPVVAATGSCLEEAGGPGAIYVDPDSPQEYANAVMTIADDNALRARMISEGREHIRAFSADNFAAGLASTYQKALNHG